MKEIKPRRKGCLMGKVLRLLGKGRGFEDLTSGGEVVHTGVSRNNYFNYRKEIETTWFEAERKKGEAIEWQRRRFIC